MQDVSALRSVRFFVRCVAVALALSACSKQQVGAKSPAQSAARRAPGPPVGLYGVWVGTARGSSQPDTLVLAPDSVAHGWDREPSRPVIAVTRWGVKYLSKDPVESRRDWTGLHYQDGGDLACTVAQDSTCVSNPVLCLGDAAETECLGFHFHGDSLALSNGAAYRRAAPIPRRG